MGKGHCKLKVPAVAAAIEAGMKPEEALAEEIKYEVSHGGRWIEVQLCECSAGTGCQAGAEE